MTMLTNREQIETFRLMTLRQGVKLEARGMTRRGKSCTTLACEALGLRKGTKRTETLAALDRAIEARLGALAGGAE